MMYYSKIHKDDYTDFYKVDDLDLYLIDPEEDAFDDIYLFSFDKEIIFDFWADFPQKLTKEQIEIFKKHNEFLAYLKGC